MTNKERLKVYDALRGLHKDLALIDRSSMGEWEENAMDALHAVFYLAEHVFAEHK